MYDPVTSAAMGELYRKLEDAIAQGKKDGKTRSQVFQAFLADLWETSPEDHNTFLGWLTD